MNKYSVRLSWGNGDEISGIPFIYKADSERDAFFMAIDAIRKSELVSEKTKAMIDEGRTPHFLIERVFEMADGVEVPESKPILSNATIGYREIDVATEEGQRILKEGELLEVSITTDEKKYTVKEVLDSCYYETVDHDGDFDGFIHIISTLNGQELKVPLRDVCYFPVKNTKERNGKLKCKCGHRHDQHGKSMSINYSAGHCGEKDCKCPYFVTMI